MSKEKNDEKIDEAEKVIDEVIAEVQMDFKKAMSSLKNFNEIAYNEISKELDNLKNDLLVQTAKIQTNSRRHQEELMNARKYAGSKLAEYILKPIDLMNKVINSETDNEEVKKYLMGFQMIMNQIEQAFETNGITKIEVNIGDEFNHDIHNANEQVESKEIPSNHIVEVISNGYKMYDRVIIHALVKVAK